MKRLSVVIPLMMVTIVTGCASQKAWVYQPNTYSSTQSGSTKTAAVLPFDDARKNENKNCIAMYLIPLMPYGWADFNTPEGVQMHITSGMWLNYKPTEDYAKALAEESRKAGVFKEAYFDYRKGNSDYFIQGKIVNTKYEGKIFSYGFSAYGPLLWFFGLPAAHTENELTIELSCVDSKTDKVVFSKSYQATPRSNVSFIYTMKNDFNYSEMLAEVYKQFFRDIKPVVYAPVTAETKVVLDQKTPVAIVAPVATTIDTMAQLKRLKELKDEGLLTEQEYENKRKEIVGQL